MMKCSAFCKHEGSAVKAIDDDIERADRDASENEKIDPKSDAEIKSSGERAAALCGSVRTHLAHARGVAWSLAATHDIVGAGSALVSNLTDAFDRIDRDATCVGRSPAQLKSDFVPKVHDLKAKNLPKANESECMARCGSRH